MSAWQPQTGTREIDRVIPPLGRVRLRTGTHDKRRAEAYDRMLDALPLDVMRLLVTREVTLREVYDRWTAGQPLPSADALRPLHQTLTGWLERPLTHVSAAEQASRARLVRTVLAAAPATATLADFPALLRGLYVTARDAGHGPTWNRQKSVAMAALRDLLGKRAPLYLDVRELPSLPEPPRFARHPCTVGEAQAIRDALGPKWGPIWWLMCVTGVGPKELWSDGWRVTAEGLEIRGQKAPARNRVVPLVVAMPAIVGRPAGFAEAVERAGLGVTPYDARRSYARWLQELGLPAYQQNALMGHGPKGMRELYPWGEIRAWLAEIGRALAQHVGAPVVRAARA